MSTPFHIGVVASQRSMSTICNCWIRVLHTFSVSLLS